MEKEINEKNNRKPPKSIRLGEAKTKFIKAEYSKRIQSQSSGTKGKQEQSSESITSDGARRKFLKSEYSKRIQNTMPGLIQRTNRRYKNISNFPTDMEYIHEEVHQIPISKSKFNPNLTIDKKKSNISKYTENLNLFPMGLVNNSERTEKRSNLNLEELKNKNKEMNLNKSIKDQELKLNPYDKTKSTFPIRIEKNRARIKGFPQDVRNIICKFIYKSFIEESQQDEF